jgi:hypothetical protein
MNGFRSRISRVSIGDRVVYDVFARSHPPRPDSHDVIKQLILDGEFPTYARTRNVTMTYNGRSWIVPPASSTGK